VEFEDGEIGLRSFCLCTAGVRAIVAMMARATQMK
jgi:hypothetical protein